MEKLYGGKGLGCEFCEEGKGYIIEKRGDLSRARLCECVRSCRICGGSGFVFTSGERGYSRMEFCYECGSVRAKVKHYNLAGIPVKFSSVLKVDTFAHNNEKSQQRALRYVKAFVEAYPVKRGFLLMGKSGLGKTHLIVGAISELTLEKNVPCLFKDFFHLLSELKAAYSQGISENEVLEPLIGAEVLAIDELGKGRNTEWELGILDQLISKRYNASKITLITTNCVSRDFALGNEEVEEVMEDRVGVRIYSRLREMCEFIYMEGDDYRGSKKGTRVSKR